MKLTPHHAKYFAFELTKRSSSESVDKLASALSDAQVDLNPHQIEAALFALRLFCKGGISRETPLPRPEGEKISLVWERGHHEPTVSAL